MICPNCGTPNNQNETFCYCCKTPLANASYTQLNQVARKARKQRSPLLPAIMLLIAIFALGGFFGYDYYQKISKEKCLTASEQLLSSASTFHMDQVKEDLPADIQGFQDAPKYLGTAFDQSLEKNHMNDALTKYKVEKDYDSIYNEIKKNASYSIDRASVSYNTCTVTVTTSNLNYKNIILSLKDELPAEDEKKESDHWWENITHWVNDYFQDAKESANLPSTLSEWVTTNAKGKAPQKVTGTLTYTFKGGKWILTSADGNLFRNLYGVADQL